MGTSTTVGDRTINWLRDTSWSSLLWHAYFLLLAGVVLKLAAPPASRPYLSRLLLVAPLLLFVTKDLAHLPDFLHRLRAAHAARNYGAMLGAFFPPEFLGLIRINRALRHGFIARIRRRPATPRPEGVAFGYLDRGSYSTVVAIVMVSSLIELPLNGFILSLFLKDPMQRHVVELLLAAASVSTVMLVLGDSWLVRGARHHVLTYDCLDLCVGARAYGRVALEAIAGCEVIKETRLAWCKRNGVRMRDTASVTPLDKPNVVLSLKPGARVALSVNGVARESPACILLYLDHPESFAITIASRVHPAAGDS